MTHDYRPHSKYDNPVDLKRCKASVGRGRAVISQCLSAPGPSGYCAVHSPEGAARRAAKADARTARYNLRSDIAAARYTVITAAQNHVECCARVGALHRAVAKLKKLEAKLKAAQL